MNSSFDEQKQNVLETFRQCHSRISARSRWNTLFSGLIPVCLVWFLSVLFHRFHLLPFGELLPGILLGTGITGILIITWKQQIDPSYAAYVFDRLNQFDGAFLTWFSGQNQSPEDTPVHTALLLEIHNTLSEETVLPDQAFPAGKAFASAGLLLAGVLAGYTIHTPDTSPLTTPSESTLETTKQTDQKEIEKRDREKNSLKPETRRKTQTKAEQLIDQLNNLRRDMKEARQEGDVPDRLSERKKQLEKNMESFLRKQNTSGADGGQQGGNGDPRDSGETADAPPQESTSRSPGSNTNKDQTTDQTSTQAPPDDGDEYRSENTDHNRADVEDVKQAFQTLKHHDFPWIDDLETAETDQRAGTGTSTMEFEPESSRRNENQDQSFRIQTDQLKTALNQSNRVRDWAPKYDRSIETYRSFLRSYVNRRENDETNN